MEKPAPAPDRRCRSRDLLRVRMFLLEPISFDCDSRAPDPVARPAASTSPAPSEPFTSTQPTPSFTEMPTILHQTPAITPYDTPNAFPGATAEPAVGVPTLEPPDVSFTDIRISANQIFWGSCPSASTLVSAQVAGPTPSRKCSWQCSWRIPRLSIRRPGEVMLLWRL
jgi:hypothetical protein